MTTDQWLLLLVMVVLTALIFYASGALVGRDWGCTGSYALRLTVVSLAAVVLEPVVVSLARDVHLGDVGLLIAFVMLIAIVRFVLVEELTVSDDWLAAIVISLVGVVLIYIVDGVANALFNIRILTLF